MLLMQFQAWFLIAVTIFCGVRTYRDFAEGNVVWGIVSLIFTILALIVILTPIPTRAVKIDLSR